MTPFRRAGSRSRLTFFFVLAFVLSWLVWGSAIAEQRGWLGFHIPQTLAYFGVSIAAFVAAAMAGGRSAVGDLLRRLVRWRVGVAWYGVAIALPILLPLVTALLWRAFGGTVPTGSAMSLGAAAGYFVYGTGLWLVTEEAGWRGFALPRLQTRGSALTASVVLGLVWGVWHTPLFLMADSAQAAWPYLGFVLFAVATSVLATWIFNHTRGSVLLAAIFHAATDASLAYSGVLDGGNGLFWAVVAVTWVAAGILVAVEGARDLARGRGVGDAELGLAGPVMPASR